MNYTAKREHCNEHVAVVIGIFLFTSLIAAGFFASYIIVS